MSILALFLYVYDPSRWCLHQQSLTIKFWMVTRNTSNSLQCLEVYETLLTKSSKRSNLFLVLDFSLVILGVLLECSFLIIG